MPTFPDIPTSDRDEDSPLDEDLFDNYHDRDEGLREQSFTLELSEVSTNSATYVTLADWRISIPLWAKIMKIVLDTKVVAATTGTYKALLDTSTASDEPTDTKTAYDPTTPTVITFSDISSLAPDTDALLELQAKNSTGGGGNLTYAQAIAGAVCYFTV